MNKTILIILAIIILLSGGWYFSRNEGSVKSIQKTENPVMKAGSYEIYSVDKLSRADNGNVVLFFRASWCPTCRALDTDIKANLSKIPENLSILDVDYDNSTELKKKYRVTYQHTLVQVDSKGDMVAKWSGSETLSRIINNIK